MVRSDAKGEDVLGLTRGTVGFLRLCIEIVAVEFLDNLLEQHLLSFGGRSKDVLDHITNLMNETTRLSLVGTTPEHVVEHFRGSTLVRT